MEKKEFLKVALFVFFFAYIQNIKAKEIVDNDTITSKSYSFFCNNIMKNDSILMSIDIYFDGIANKQVSDIFYIADCLNDISLIKDSIPNKKKLAKIDKKAKKQKSKKVKKLEIDYLLFLPEETMNSFNLLICSPLTYKESVYQEYRLINKYNEIRRIIIEIDKNTFEPIGYCSNSFIYG